MDFDIEKDKVIGEIEKELGGRSARIKAIGMLRENNTIYQFTDYEVRRKFPPAGFIFEPGFFYNEHHKIGDLVSFFAQENEQSKYEQDMYRLRGLDSQIKYFGIPARKVSGFTMRELTTNLSSIVLETDDSDGAFYGITDKYIIGKLKSKNGIVEPALNHRIKIWDIDEDNVLSHNNTFLLLDEPNDYSIVVNCMNDKQLFDWFRNLLKAIEPDYVNLLDKNATWRTEIPKLLSNTDNDRSEADKIRFKLIEDKFNLLSLSVSEINNLVNNSVNLKLVFAEIIETHKEEYKFEYEEELEKFRLDIEKQKTDLLLNENKLDIKIKQKENELNQLIESLQVMNDEIALLSKNKDRIIDDFSIIKEVLNKGNYIDKVQPEIEEEPFVMEESLKYNYNDVNDISEFEEQLKYQLYLYDININYSRKILDCLLNYKAVLVKDIRIGIALAKSTNNSKYIIQQVEPDWLHFNDLWKNGLGAIWQSAHEHPDICYFLLLEDINMSAPECYCRPLLDIIDGIRELIPYGKSSYPNNLKIIATYASYQEPEIGLPLNEGVFANWGLVGFTGDTNKKIEYNTPAIEKYLPVSLLLKQEYDDFTKSEIENDVLSNLHAIF